MKDFLGNGIVKGDRYCFVSSAGSLLTIGILIDFDEKKCCIRVSEKRNIVNGESKIYTNWNKKFIEIESCKLIKI